MFEEDKRKQKLKEFEVRYKFIYTHYLGNMHPTEATAIRTDSHLSRFILKREGIPRKHQRESSQVSHSIIIFSGDIFLIAMERFELRPKDAYRIWKKFIKFDKNVVGYINLDDLFYMVRERSNSIVAPYLDRLYELMYVSEF